MCPSSFSRDWPVMDSVSIEAVSGGPAHLPSVSRLQHTLSSANSVVSSSPSTVATQHRRYASMGQPFIPPNSQMNNGNLSTTYANYANNRQMGDTVSGLLDPFFAYQRYHQQQSQCLGVQTTGPYVWLPPRYQTPATTVVSTIGHTSVSTAVMLPSNSITNSFAPGYYAEREFDRISQSASDSIAMTMNGIANGNGEASLTLDNDSAGSDSSAGVGGVGSEVTFGGVPPLPYLEGRLNKWTNLLHGWQERFFVLSDGTLSYFKSKEEQNLGCRGSLRLAQATVRPHEYDDCRFEVRLGDNIWYLRGSSLSERHTWIQGLECHRIADIEASLLQTATGAALATAAATGQPIVPSGLQVTGIPSSAAAVSFMAANPHLSVPSTASHSLASASSFQKGHRLREKLAEMETFKEILCKQVDTLQAYFDSCSQVVRNSQPSLRRSNSLTASTVSNATLGLHHVPELPEELWDPLGARFHQHLSSRTAAEVLLGSAHDMSDEEHHHRLPAGGASLPSQNGAKNHMNGVESVDVVEDDCDRCSSITGVDMYADALNTLANSEVDDDDLQSALSGLTPTRSPASSLSKQQLATLQQQQTTNQTTQQQQQQAQQSRGFLSRLFFRSNGSAAAGASAASSNAASGASSVTEMGAENQLPDAQDAGVDFCQLHSVLARHGAQAPDFRGEAITFKATTAGILATLGHSIDLMLQSEDQWRHRLERERDKRRRQEEVYRLRVATLMEELRREREANASLLQQQSKHVTSKMTDSGKVTAGAVEGPTSETSLFIGSPDIEEGPHCQIDESTMKEALEMQMDQLAKQEDLREAIRKANENLSTASRMSSSHPLYSVIQRVVSDHLMLCDPTGLNHSPADGWQEIASDGEMHFFKREITSSDGKVLDPLQAVHIIDGITAHELCDYFWNVKYRMEWEFTIEQPPQVLEVCGEDTMVLHQVYRRVWPTSQRDGVFWSHIRHISREDLGQQSSENSTPPNTYPLPGGKEDYWMVLNYSTDYLAPDLKEMPNQVIRLTVDVVMIAQTLRRNPNLPCTRDNICCRMLYAASIDPGGWVPAVMLRKLTQREYPRFVKLFSNYVAEKTKGKPLFW